MKREALAPDLRRFVESIPTVACLEAILLLRHAHGQPWDIKTLARRLYMAERAATELMQALHAAGICAPVQGAASQFIYQPVESQLDQLIGRLALYYAKNLIEVTNIIHAKAGSTSQRPAFDGAFVWREP